MKKSIIYIFTLICSIIVFFIISILLFRFPIFNIFDVLMYKGLVIIFISSLLLFFSLYFVKKFNLIKKVFSLISINDILSITIVFFCINAMVFTLIPVTIERSISVFTLFEIEKRDGQTISIDEAEDVFIEKYVKEKKAFDKRFHEQIVTGSIEKIDNDNYKLTNRGKIIVDLFNIISKLYNVKSSHE